MFEVSKDEFEFLRSKFSTTKFTKTRTLPKVFSEKGLYMIATIIKSKKATDATFSIIEAFSKIRELSRNVKELSTVQDKQEQQKLMQKSGEIIVDILDDGLEPDESETTIELNLAVLKQHANHQSLVSIVFILTKNIIFVLNGQIKHHMMQK